MADPEDRALGVAIRSRRFTLGMQQQEVAERIGMAPVVYGRIELGLRPARATELRDISRVLGVSADDLLRSISTESPEQIVERASVCQIAAHKALQEYNSALDEAVNAVKGCSHGVLMGDVRITSEIELHRWLETFLPSE